ncbi:mCG145455, partial [Mus musculus]
LPLLAQFFTLQQAAPPWALGVKHKQAQFCLWLLTQSCAGLICRFDVFSSLWSLNCDRNAGVWCPHPTLPHIYIYICTCIYMHMRTNPPYFHLGIECQSSHADKALSEVEISRTF